MSRAWVVAVSGGGDSVSLCKRACSSGSPNRLVWSCRSPTLTTACVGRLRAGGCGLCGGTGALRWASPDRPGRVAARSREPLPEADAARPIRLAHASRSRARCPHLAAGHTRDDEAETIIHRIYAPEPVHARGSARHSRASNLGGETAWLTLVRPLLQVFRGVSCGSARIRSINPFAKTKPTRPLQPHAKPNSSRPVAQAGSRVQPGRG